MRALVVVVVVLSSASAYADDALKVKVAPPKKGEVVDLVAHGSSDMHGTMNGKKLAQTIVFDESSTQEVLAVDKDVVTKERVSFTAAHQKVGGDTTKDEDLPVAKKSYVATAVDGKVSFTDAKGGKVADAEVALLARTADNVGQPDKVSVLFGDKAFSKGVAVSLSAGELTSLMGADDQFPAADMTLTLVENDGKRARFDVAGTMEGDKQGLHLTAKFTGTATIDLARGRLVDFQMNAVMKMKSDKGPVTADVDIKVAAQRTATYH
jgi:hypothetical protein